MKLLKILSLFACMFFSANTFTQETARAEKIKKLQKNIAACKMLVKKAIEEGNPDKLGKLQAAINRLQ